MLAIIWQADDIRRGGGEAVAAQCNVQDDAAQEAAFAAHLRAWGRLDVAVLNAGIFEKGARRNGHRPPSHACVPLASLSWAPIPMHA